MPLIDSLKASVELLVKAGNAVPEEEGLNRALERFRRVIAAGERAAEGLGAAEGLDDFLVPDTMWLLSVKPTCMIHDWMYAWGITREDKERADEVFLNNMQRIILANTRYRWLRKKRIQRAKLYYWAVKVGGGPAFWIGKNRPEEMAVVGLAA